MPAQDYFLAVSGLGGRPYIAKVSKKDSRIMTNDRRQIPKSEFIQAVLDWTKPQLREGRDTLQITSGGKLIAEIKLFTDVEDKS